MSTLLSTDASPADAQPPDLRHDDGTWPLDGARIAHARRRDLRREGYGLREGYDAVRRWAQRGLEAADVDVRLTRDFVVVGVHWDDLWTWERATRDGQPWRRRVSDSTWDELSEVRLHGRRRRPLRDCGIHRAEDYLDGPQSAVRRLWSLATHRSFTPFFELKDDRFASPEGAAALAGLHAEAVARGGRYAVMAMPEDGHGLLRLGARGPAFGLLLARGPVTTQQWAAVDGAKGPARWLVDAPAGKRLYGRHRRWGGTRIVD